MLLCILCSTFFFDNHWSVYICTWLLVEVLLQVNWGIVLGIFVANTPFPLSIPNEVILLYDASGHSGWNSCVLRGSLIFDHLNSVRFLALSKILLCLIHTLNKVFGSMTHSTGGNGTTISVLIELLLLIREFRTEPCETFLAAQLANLWSPHNDGCILIIFDLFHGVFKFWSHCTLQAHLCIAISWQGTSNVLQWSVSFYVWRFVLLKCRVQSRISHDHMLVTLRSLSTDESHLRLVSLAMMSGGANAEPRRRLIPLIEL